MKGHIFCHILHQWFGGLGRIGAEVSVEWFNRVVMGTPFNMSLGANIKRRGFILPEHRPGGTDGEGFIFCTAGADLSWQWCLGDKRA